MLQDIIAENRAQSERLASLAKSLQPADLERPLGGGWTVAMAFAHVAFWERRGRLLLRRWAEGHPLEDDPDWYSPVLNGALEPEWRALPPSEALRLALDGVEAMDEEIASLPPVVVEAIVAGGQGWRVRRSNHRREHLDQVEDGLKGG